MKMKLPPRHIGIASAMSTARLAHYFPECDRAELESLSEEYFAPAVDNLIDGFHSAGVRLSLFTLCQKAKRERVFCGDGVDLYVAPMRSRGKWRAADHYFFEVRSLRRLMANMAEPPDLFHAHWTYEFALSIAHRPEPKVITLRDWPREILNLNRNLYWFMRYVMACRALRLPGVTYLANSPYLAALYAAKYQRAIPVIPNAIEDAFILPAPRQYDPENRRVLFIGDSKKRKNATVLLQAIKRLRTDGFSVELDMLGIYSDDPQVKKWRGEGLLEGVNICGRVGRDELAGFIDRAALLAHPALEESFGNIFLEAMARGVPVIGGKNSGAVPWVLGNGKAGWLCDVTKPEELARGIGELLGSAITYGKYAESGHAWCREKFSLASVVAAHLELYNTVLEASE